MFIYKDINRNKLLLNQYFYEQLYLNDINNSIKL